MRDIWCASSRFPAPEKTSPARRETGTRVAPSADGREFFFVRADTSGHTAGSGDHQEIAPQESPSRLPLRPAASAQGLAPLQSAQRGGADLEVEAQLGQRDPAPLPQAPESGQQLGIERPAPPAEDAVSRGAARAEGARQPLGRRNGAGSVAHTHRGNERDPGAQAGGCKSRYYQRRVLLSSIFLAR